MIDDVVRRVIAKQIRLLDHRAAAVQQDLDDAETTANELRASLQDIEEQRHKLRGFLFSHDMPEAEWSQGGRP